MPTINDCAAALRDHGLARERVEHRNELERQASELRAQAWEMAGNPYLQAVVRLAWLHASWGYRGVHVNRHRLWEQVDARLAIPDRHETLVAIIPQLNALGLDVLEFEERRRDRPMAVWWDSDPDGPVTVAVRRGRVSIDVKTGGYATTFCGTLDLPPRTTATGHLVMITWREAEPPVDWAEWAGWTPARVA